jgi:hypothetical protein
MKLPGGWRWGVAAAVIALMGLVLWYKGELQEPRPQEPVSARPVPQQPDGVRGTSSRERPGRDRSPRPE